MNLYFVKDKQKSWEGNCNACFISFFFFFLFFDSITSLDRISTTIDNFRALNYNLCSELYMMKVINDIVNKLYVKPNSYCSDDQLCRFS